MTTSLIPGLLQSYARFARGLICDYGPVQLSITVLAPGLLRVRAAPGGNFAPRRSWAVVAPDADFAPVDFSLRQDADELLLDTGVLRLYLERNGARMRLLDPADAEFCVDAAAPEWTTEHVLARKRLVAAERLYGFGQRGGLINRRGRSMRNWTSDPPIGHGPGTDPMYCAIPVFLALRPGLAYGVFLNSTRAGRFDAGVTHPDHLLFEVNGDQLDYYIVYGPTPADVLAGVGRLLGTTPLPPRWALGYHQSRWSYHSADEIRELAREFRRRDIPCDAIHFDIDYMQGYRVFTWDESRFPDPAGLLQELRVQGFRGVAIIDPGVKVDPAYPVYREGLEKDYFIRRADGDVYTGYVWPDAAVFADFTRPEVRRWWGDLQAGLIRQGMAGIWNDMNEPTVFDRPFSAGGSNAGTLPLDAPQGSSTERTTHAEVHNLFASQMVQASYEGLRRHLGEQRPFVLTRAAFAGIQRYAACWMGDNCSWWEHLQMAIPQLLSMSISGVPFVGVDIGGFYGNAGPELFARWMQLGALLPFCRGHSAAGSQPHEPWRFGAQVEQICRDALRLRYRLLPYAYSLFHAAADNGAPPLRPLFYEFPADPATYELSDQFMLGPALLAAPVVAPGAEYRHVYLPAGDWYDWWSGERFVGPQHLLVHAPLDHLPLFARGGAIVPCGPAMAHTSEKPLDPLTLHLYPGNGSFQFYEDDGVTMAYQRGACCTTVYRLRQENGRTYLHISPRQGNYAPPARRLELRCCKPDGRLLHHEFPDDGSEHQVGF